VVLGDFNDYDNAHKDAANHTSITNVLPFIKEAVTPHLLNTVQFIEKQNKRYTHWPQSSFDPAAGDTCGYGHEFRSYIDQYDYILLSEALTSFVQNVSIHHNYCGVYSSDHLPLVVHLEAPYLSDVYVATFGFKTASSTYSGGNAATYVYVRLHWFHYIYWCRVYAPNADTYYLCDARNTIQTENCDDDESLEIESKFEIQIEYHHSNQMFIDEIYVTDVSGHYYAVNKFCVSSTATQTIGNGASVGDDANCSVQAGEEYVRYDELCMDDACTTSVSIVFMDENPIENAPDTYGYGIVSDEATELSNGLICSSSPTVSPTTAAPTHSIVETTTITVQTTTAETSTTTTAATVSTDTGGATKFNHPGLMLLFSLLCAIMFAVYT